MHKTSAEAVKFLEVLAPNVKLTKHKVIICAPFTALHSLWWHIKEQKSKIRLYAQNLYPSPEGAFTGEISPIMVKEYCDGVLVGHSERRLYFNETNEFINDKVKAALAHKLKVILCVGETALQRKKKQSEIVTITQLKECLKGVSTQDLKNIVIAYEPVWAISTFPGAKPITPPEGNAMHEVIKKWFTTTSSTTMPVMYGGSAKPENCEEFCKQPDIDGFLIGGASLEPKSFLEMVKKST
jgi:triosephosphate isomerase (TIM)